MKSIYWLLSVTISISLVAIESNPIYTLLLVGVKCLQVDVLVITTIVAFYCCCYFLYAPQIFEVFFLGHLRFIQIMASVFSLSLSFSLTYAHTLYLTLFSLSGLFIKWTKAISFSQQAEVRTIFCRKKHFSPKVRFGLFLTQLMLSFFSLDCALLLTLCLYTTMQ